MLLSFSGHYPQKVDAKGRMSVPAALRRVVEAKDPDWAEGLPSKVYINYGKHLRDHLRVYSVEAMMRIAGKIDAMEDGSRDQRNMRRVYLGQSEEANVDKDGRLVLSMKLREKLGLTDGELTLMGMGDHFEIWKAENYESIDDDLDDWLSEIGEDTDPLVRAKPAPVDGDV